MSIGDSIELVVKPRARPLVVCGPSRTKQAFAEQVNINSIMARYNRTGMVDHINRTRPFYGDVSSLVSYQESLEVVRRSEELFSKMSAAVREKFGNDPSAMVAFLADDRNTDEAIKLGLVKPRPVEPAAEPGKGSEGGKPS